MKTIPRCASFAHPRRATMLNELGLPETGCHSSTCGWPVHGNPSSAYVDSEECSRKVGVHAALVAWAEVNELARNAQAPLSSTPASPGLPLRAAAVLRHRTPRRR